MNGKHISVFTFILVFDCFSTFWEHQIKQRFDYRAIINRICGNTDSRKKQMELICRYIVRRSFMAVARLYSSGRKLNSTGDMGNKRRNICLYEERLLATFIEVIRSIAALYVVKHIKQIYQITIVD